MLAQAAKNASLQPLVIDLFADLDTQAYAADFKQITALTIECLTPALEYFIKHYGATQVVYGSGFEQYPDSLRYIAGRFTLLGNSPETFSQLHDKVHFFATLKQLNIPTPETTFVLPTDTHTRAWWCRYSTPCKYKPRVAALHNCILAKIPSRHTVFSFVSSRWATPASYRI
jgi:hypothetical protein